MADEKKISTRKLVQIIAVAVLLVAAVGYSLLWYSQAKVAKDVVAQAIENLNAEREIITYQSLVTHGFPFELQVVLDRPQMKIPVQSLLQPFAHSMPPAPDGTDQAALRKALLELPEWVETILLDGTLTISVNALSNSYRMTPRGNYVVQSKVGSNAQNYTLKFAEGPRGCRIDFKRAAVGTGLKLWNWDYLTNDATALFEAVSAIQCAVPEMSAHIGGEGEASFESDAVTFDFSNSGRGSKQHYHLTFDAPHYQATPAFDVLMADYYHAFFPEKPLPMQYHMAPYGAQSLTFAGDFAYDNKETESSPLKVAVHEFSYRSDISNTTMKLLFDAIPDKQGGTVVWDATLDTNFKEPAYLNYVSQAREFARQLYLALKQSGTRLEMDEPAFVAQYVAMVPKLHELGTIRAALKGNGTLSPEGQADFQIDTIAISAADYGLEMEGKGNIASFMMPIPVGNFSLTCTRCLTMVDDGTAWFRKFQPLLKITGEPNTWTELNVTDAMVASIKQFLTRLAPNDTETLHYNLVLTPEGKVSINAMPLDEVMALYEAYVGKFLNNTPDQPTPGQAMDESESAVAPQPHSPESPAKD